MGPCACKPYRARSGRTVRNIVKMCMEDLYETGVAESIGADDDFLRRFFCPPIIGGVTPITTDGGILRNRWRLCNRIGYRSNRWRHSNNPTSTLFISSGAYFCSKTKNETKFCFRVISIFCNTIRKYSFSLKLQPMTVERRS
jgi:hypothetical protein